VNRSVALLGRDDENHRKDSDLRCRRCLLDSHSNSSVGVAVRDDDGVCDLLLL